MRESVEFQALWGGSGVKVAEVEYCLFAQLYLVLGQLGCLQYQYGAMCKQRTQPFPI